MGIETGSDGVVRAIGANGEELPVETVKPVTPTNTDGVVEPGAQDDALGLESTAGLAPESDEEDVPTDNDLTSDDQPQGTTVKDRARATAERFANATRETAEAGAARFREKAENIDVDAIRGNTKAAFSSTEKKFGVEVGRFVTGVASAAGAFAAATAFTGASSFAASVVLGVAAFSVVNSLVLERMGKTRTQSTASGIAAGVGTFFAIGALASVTPAVFTTALVASGAYLGYARKDELVNTLSKGGDMLLSAKDFGVAVFELVMGAKKQEETQAATPAPAAYGPSGPGSSI